MTDTSLAATVQLFAAQAAIFQALLLTASAVHKAARWSHSLLVVRQFAGVPAALASAALGAAIAVELAGSALLLMSSQRMTGAVLAALIWSLYGALLVRAVVEGRRDVDCGCSFGPTSRPLGPFQIVRNVVLAVLAVSIAWVSASSGAVAMPGTFVVGGLALLALYGALDQVMGLQPLRRGELL